MSADSNAAHDLLGKVVADAYQLIAYHGNVESLALFDAKHTRLKRHADVWVLPQQASEDPVYLEMVRERAACYAAVSHPHLVQLLDYDLRSDALAALLFEQAEGFTLADCVQAYGPFELDPWVEVAHQLIAAFCALHEGGYYVGNFSPAHARVRTINEQPFIQVVNPEIVRSAASEYQAPETAQHPATIRSDLYSLAQTLYFLIAGKRLEPLVPGHSLADSGVQRRDADVPLAIEKVLRKAAASHPNDRYQSLHAFREALEGATLKQHLGIARSDSPSTLPPPPGGSLAHTPTPGALRYGARNTPLESTAYRVSSRPPTNPKVADAQSAADGSAAVDASTAVNASAAQRNLGALGALQDEIATISKGLKSVRAELQAEKLQGYQTLSQARTGLVRLEEALKQLQGQADAASTELSFAQREVAALSAEVRFLVADFIAEKVGGESAPVMAKRRLTSAEELKVLTGLDVFLLSQLEQPLFISELRQISPASGIETSLALVHLYLRDCLRIG